VSTQAGARLERQSLEGHRRILGILFIVLNAVTLLGALAMGLVFGMMGALMDDLRSDESILFVLIGGGMVGCIALLGLPGIIAGIGLLRRKRWSRMFALVMGCLAIPSFPLGTALGVYALWFYTQPGSDRVFE
jgi:hypothetical protein